MDTHSDSQNHHLPSSISQLSEPPDIRNWFSSYKYESFVLDTYEFVGDGGVYDESGRDLDGCVAVEEGNKEKGEDSDECKRKGSSSNELYGDPSVSEMPDSLYLSPPLSEPPHIINLFSSYVPETPALDSLDDLKEYVPIEGECAKDENVVEVSGREREENFDELGKSSDCNEVGADENLRLDDLVMRKDPLSDFSENQDASQSSSFLSEPPDIRNWFSSYVYESPELGESIGFPLEENDLKKDDFANHCSNNKKVQLHGLPKSEIFLGDEQDTISFKDEDPRSGYALSEGNEGSSYQGRTFPTGAVTVQNTTVDIDTRARIETNVESNDKENVGQGVSGEGFVTVKRRNDTNLSDRSETIFQRGSKNKRTSSSSGTEKAVAAKRNVLSERTNLDNVTEVTGKWKCPQKSKPNVGPPMKQLRLERWVHRV